MVNSSYQVRFPSRGYAARSERARRKNVAQSSTPRKSSAQIARNLGFTSATAAVIDSDLETAQSTRGRAHLHLKIPTVSLIRHAERP
jgi:hypothetical protein